MTVRVFFAWYDLWVGVYVDRPGRAVYVCPLPCLVFRVGEGAASEAGRLSGEGEQTPTDADVVEVCEPGLTPREQEDMELREWWYGQQGSA